MNLTTLRPFRLVQLVAISATFTFAPLNAQNTAADPASKKDQIVRIEDIEVRDTPISALTVAPVESSLDALQPQSIISLQTIQNSIVPTADYAMIANLAPSVTNASTNGPGLNESKVALRGLADGQYNITFDGIPFGDGNDFTHHSTSYFPAKMIGRMTIDRGPGTADTIGMATFGGTIAMQSKDPLEHASFIPTISHGSWNTNLDNFEFNTGLLPKANNASFIGSYQYMSSDGYHTYGTLSRNTYWFKYLQPIGRNTTLSFFGSYNNIKFNNPNNSAPTLQQILTLGRNFAQTNDPTIPVPGNPVGSDYLGTNWQRKHADMEYIGLNTDLGGGWRIEDKLYTFDYNNESHESPNINSGSTYNPATGTVTKGTDLGGQYKVNVVRAYGTYFAAIHDDAMGTLKTGVWFDYQKGPRYNYYMDYNTANAQAIGLPAFPGGFLDLYHSGSGGAATDGAATLGGFAWNMHFQTRTWQPYIDYAWHVTPALTVEPGLKYISVNRSVWGPVNQDKEVQSFSYDQTFSKLLPLVSINYRLKPEWSVYGQVADGFLTPALAFSSELNPQLNNIKPQTTTNYQLGTVYKTNRFNADFDGYWINYSNLPIQYQNPADNVDPNDLIYYDAKGAYYYGVEGEGTFYVGKGLSIFANGSRNYATYKGTKRRVENVAQYTAGSGLIYDYSGFSASIMEKYIGPYTVYSPATNPDVPLAPTALTFVQGGYAMTDLALSYGRKLPKESFIKSVKVRLQIADIFNREVNLLKKPNANPLLSTYTVLAPRSVFLTISAEY